MDQKPTFRNALKDFVEATSDTPIDKLSTVQQSKIMTRFYIEELVRRLVPGIVPEDQEDYEACMIDGANDCGVDFLVRRDGRVFVVQAKYHARKYTEEADQFSHFADVLKRIAPSAKNYKRNERLSDAIADIDWENDTFELHYVSLGKAADNVRAREKQGVSGLPDLHDADDRAELVLLDESDLNVRYREALFAGEAIMEEVPVLFWANAGQPPWLTFTNKAGRVSYVGRISGSQLAEIYAHHRYKLFAMNIRDYVGDTSTNKGIIKTAVEGSDDFFFFNNGISAVATGIEPDVDKNQLLCQRLSIINGAQTVRSIAKAQKRNADAVRDVSVMVRISQFALNAGAGEQSFLDSITRFNNTQNSIKVSDFRSNDPVQTELAHRFEKLNRGGKKFWYKNKRVAKQDANRIPIGMEEFAKTVFAFRFGPDDMYGGTRFLFDTNTDGGYRMLFGDDNGVWDALTEEEFKLLAGSWLICEHVRAVWNKEKERRLADGLPETKNALERRLMVYFVVGELLRDVYRQVGNLDSEIRRLSKPSWMLEDGVEARTIEKYTRLGCSVLIKAYRAASKGADFSHRNWFREKATISDIRQEIPSELQTLKMILDSGELPTLSAPRAGRA
jgi:hypothetical protein